MSVGRELATTMTAIQSYDSHTVIYSHMAVVTQDFGGKTNLRSSQLEWISDLQPC